MRNPNHFTNQLELSEGLRKLVEEQNNISWLPDLIWHYQTFDTFKDHSFQTWTVEKKTGKSKFQSILIIKCFASNKHHLAQNDILECVSIQNLDFPFEDLTILYEDGNCLLFNDSINQLKKYQ